MVCGKGKSVSFEVIKISVLDSLLLCYLWDLGGMLHLSKARFFIKK